MTMQELANDTPEADALARRILTALYECAAAAQGRELGAITITRRQQSAPAAANCGGAMPGAKPGKVFGGMNMIAQIGGERNP